jgi:glycosyltransferase involved in cell wall biosynthesis
MNLKPLVSVVIPAYNSADWIAETISSVLNQDYQNLEIIVVNDGSTDNTELIVKSFGEKVKYIYKSNGGQSSARNLGILNSSGEYIAFIDSDDLWEKEKTSVQVKYLEENSYKWIYSDGIAFDNLSKEVLFQFSKISRPYDGNVLINLFHSCFIPMPTVLLKKEIFLEVGYFNEDDRFRNREDWEMWLRIANYYPIAYVPQILIKYRVHNKSVTGKESLIERMNGNILVIQNAVLNNPEKLARYKSQVLFNLFYSTGRAISLRFQFWNANKLFLMAFRERPLSFKLYIAWFFLPISPLIEVFRFKSTNE